MFWLNVSTYSLQSFTALCKRSILMQNDQKKRQYVPLIETENETLIVVIFRPGTLLI